MLRRMSKRLIVFLTFLAVVVIVGSYLPVPYYSEAPGPARQVEPLISFTGHQRYDSQGRFVLTSVLESVNRLTPLSVLGAWLDPNRAVVPEQDLLVPGGTQQQEHQRAVSQMDQSKLDAVAAVLSDLDGYPTLADMPGLSPLCWSMQPDRAPVAFRNRGLIRDYDARPDAMLAEGPA